jgi:hypothetical protein
MAQSVCFSACQMNVTRIGADYVKETDTYFMDTENADYFKKLNGYKGENSSGYLANFGNNFAVATA